MYAHKDELILANKEERRKPTPNPFFSDQTQSLLTKSRN